LVDGCRCTRIPFERRTVNFVEQEQQKHIPLFVARDHSLDSSSAGAIHLRLQMNSNQTGMLASYGYALRTIALRSHAGDVVLFTPNNAGSFVVKVSLARSDLMDRSCRCL
jgi:hypothetical protein